MTAQDADSETQIASLLALSQEWADSMDAGIAGDSATFLDQLFGHFQRKYPGNNGLTYGRPQHHSLEPDWLLQSPNWWGRPARALHDEHSMHLGTHIREMIAKATRSVDIVTLAAQPSGGLIHDSGWFQECIGTALNLLAEKNLEIDVRILFGNYVPALKVRPDTRRLLENLVSRWAPKLKGSKVRVYAGSMRYIRHARPSWPHAKIIAVDGRWAMVGGHNWWWADYLCSAPAHDLSMKFQGPAAAEAQRFCNRLWQHVNFWKWDWRQPENYSDMYDGPTSTLVVNRALSDVAVVDPGPIGSTRIMPVGRLDILDHDLKSDQSDEAFILALGSARRSIRISAQDLLLLAAPNLGYVYALADAVLKRDVDVHIVLSDPSGTVGGGENYSTGASWNWTNTVIAAAFRAYGFILQIPPQEIRDRTARRLRVVMARFSDDARWPADRDHRLADQPRADRQIVNHAKMWMVDDHLFYIGSHNLYPATLQEYGVIVDDAQAANTLKTEYWDKLWFWSAKAAERGGEIDPAILNQEMFSEKPGSE